MIKIVGATLILSMLRGLMKLVIIIGMIDRPMTFRWGIDQFIWKQPQRGCPALLGPIKADECVVSNRLPIVCRR